MRLRQAHERDAATLAAIYRESREKAMPWLARLHSPAEDLFFFESSVLKSGVTWAAERAGALVGFCTTRPDFIDHLYVRPDASGAGIGAALLAHAKIGQTRLYAWTFQRNLAGRQFLERHGFDIAEMTDGRRNEEKEADVLFLWQAPPT